ncbi:hypothetical protein [Shimazuella alba]|nr:hypothetical protein [Shimazuella alba]
MHAQAVKDSVTSVRKNEIVTKEEDLEQYELEHVRVGMTNDR